MTSLGVFDIDLGDHDDGEGDEAEAVSGFLDQLFASRKKQKPRCVVVLSAPRSGASMIAGLMHHLSVDMGSGYWQKTDVNNPKGYFEDIRWKALNMQLVGPNFYLCRRPNFFPNNYQKEKYAHLVMTCSEDNFVWGFNDPRACFILDMLYPFLRGVEIRMVSVHREFVDAAASLQRHSKNSYGGRNLMSMRAAQEITSRWLEAMKGQLELFTGPVHPIELEALISDPDTVVADLYSFCFEGIDDTVPFDALSRALGWMMSDEQEGKKRG